MGGYGGSGWTVCGLIFPVKNGARGVWFRWCIEFCGIGWGGQVDVVTCRWGPKNECRSVRT
jgi:hypothetical protein